MTNGNKGRDQTTDESHLTREDQRTTETPSAIYTIKEIADANRGRDQSSDAIEDRKLIATEKIRHVVAYPFQNGPDISQMRSRSKMVSCKNSPIDWSRTTKR